MPSISYCIRWWGQELQINGEKSVFEVRWRWCTIWYVCGFDDQAAVGKVDSKWHMGVGWGERGSHWFVVKTMLFCSTTIHLDDFACLFWSYQLYIRRLLVSNAYYAHAVFLQIPRFGQLQISTLFFYAFSAVLWLCSQSSLHSSKLIRPLFRFKIKKRVALADFSLILGVVEFNSYSRNLYSCTILYNHFISAYDLFNFVYLFAIYVRSRCSPMPQIRFPSGWLVFYIIPDFNIQYNYLVEYTQKSTQMNAALKEQRLSFSRTSEVSQRAVLSAHQSKEKN